MRYVLCAAVALAILAAAVSASGPTQQPKTRTVRYDKLGFAVEVPVAAVKHTAAATGAVLADDVYTFGELAYTVRVSNPSTDTLTATAIEQALQSDAASAGGQTVAPRWEMILPGDVLAKGLSGPLPAEESAARSEWIRKALRGAPGYRSLGMLPIGGDTSPILTLGVVGPRSRSADIESLAKFLVRGVGLLAVKPVEPPATTLKPSATPVVPKPKPTPDKLKKSDIELVGRVESIDADQHIVNMLVEQIRLPAMKSIRFDKPRRKAVFYKALPEGIAADSRVRVVGMNTGVGNPMTADIIQPDK